MGWPHIEISENGRTTIAKAASVLNIISIPLCLVLLIIGTYIQVSVQSKIKLIEGFNGDILPAFMISVALLGILSNIFGCRVCWVNHQVEKRPVWRKYLLPYTILTFVLYLSVLVSGIVCFSHITALRSAFQKGLSNAMNEYSTDIAKKIELDTLQIEFQCCGCDSYTDWFHVSWIREDYIPHAKLKASKKKSKDGKYRNDDAPFSCCNPNYLRPCVHHHVHDNYKHFNYDYRAEVSLYKQGCRDALMDFYGGQILTETGATVLFISFIQLILLILVRILQTAIDNAMESGSPEDPSIAHIFPWGRTAMKNLQKGIKKYHKGEEGDDPNQLPLLDEYGMEVVDETFLDETTLQGQDDGVYNISVTGSFVSDYDTDKDLDFEDQQERLENTYVSIPQLPRTSTQTDAYVQPPNFPEEGGQTGGSYYSMSIPNYLPPPPPPPPPVGNYQDYETMHLGYPEEQSFNAPRSAYRYVNEM